jgi:hypothetical protein
MINSKSKLSNTGYKGIYFDKINGNFRARLSIKNESWYNIGSFETLKETVKAREDFIKSLF